MTNVALTGLARDLAKRASEGRPVRIGVIGSGEMGTDLVTQGMLMPGVAVCAVSTRRPHTARDAIRIAYGDEAMAVEADSASKVTAAIEAGKIAITSNEMLVTNPLIDVVIDATGKPGVAADFDLKAMQHGKHLVMMNVEADVTIGCYLKQQADRLGVVYSVGAGDEPSSCMELIEFTSALGYTIVSAGKGKNNPLNHDAVPDDYRAEALRRNMNPRMLVEFVDGSKTMVEMCAIANATGLVPDVPGMHGPRPTAMNWQKCSFHALMVASCRRRVSSTTRSARAWRPASSSLSRRRIRASSSAWTICISVTAHTTASSGPTI